MDPLPETHEPAPVPGGTDPAPPCPPPGVLHDASDESKKNSFSLSTESARRQHLTRSTLEGWRDVYGTDHRQLRRWIQVGEQKADPCPLDAPWQMPGWWARNMKHQVPGKILAAAQSHPKPADPAPAESPTVQAPDENESGDESAEEGIILGDLTMEQGEEVAQARRLVKAAYNRLVTAYEDGTYIDLYQKRWELAQKIYIAAQAKEDERRKRNREWIPRVDIAHDLSRACQMLAQMRESMVRQVFELVPGLDPAIRERIGKAILEVRSREDRVFRNLDSMKTPSDVQSSLAA